MAVLKRYDSGEAAWVPIAAGAPVEAVEYSGSTVAQGATGQLQVTPGTIGGTGTRLPGISFIGDSTTGLLRWVFGNPLLSIVTASDIRATFGNAGQDLYGRLMLSTDVAGTAGSAHINAAEAASAPAAPASGRSVIYPKTDGLWYSKDDAGNETLMSSGPAVAPSVADAKGDILAATGNDTVDNFPVGSDGAYLVADSTQTFGLRWGNAPTKSAANTADITANAADTYLLGVNVGAANRLQAGSIIRFIMFVTKTAAGTAAPVFTLRIGTAGTTADIARLTWTSTAQTAAADTGRFTVEAAIRTAGATATLSGWLHMMKTLTTAAGFHNVAAQHRSMVHSTSATVNTTLANLIVGLSVNPGTAGVWTFSHVSAEILNLAS